MVESNTHICRRRDEAAGVLFENQGADLVFVEVLVDFVEFEFLFFEFEEGAVTKSHEYHFLILPPTTQQVILRQGQQRVREGRVVLECLLGSGTKNLLHLVQNVTGLRFVGDVFDVPAYYLIVKPYGIECIWVQ